VGTAVFALAAELTDWRRKENPLRCGFKYMLLFLLLFLLLKLQRKEKKVLFKTKCWRLLFPLWVLVKENKGDKGLISEKCWEGDSLPSQPPVHNPPHTFLPIPERQQGSTPPVFGTGTSSHLTSP